MSIIAILCAIFAPVALKARNAATQFSALSAIRQLMPATSMYMADADDRFPVPFYATMDSKTTWYGGVRADGTVDPRLGLISPYTGGRVSKDPTHIALPWRGDMSGFGYNWGFLGSRYYYGYDRVDWMVPAIMTELSEPSKTIAYATSAYYYAPWSKGDGRVYDYGYIDPPFAWKGAPTVDCRHMGEKRVVLEEKSVQATGSALAVRADGSAVSLRLGQIKNAMFVRQPRDE